MKPVSGKRMCRILEQHSWTRSNIKGSHHTYRLGDPPRSVSVPVHGNRDLPTGTQKTIMRQAGLTDDDL